MLESVEQLDFKIVLSGTYWTKKPEFEILFDNQLVLGGTINAPSSSRGIVLLDGDSMDQSPEYQKTTLETFEFSCSVEPGEHMLGIRLLNKAPGDTRGFVPGGWTRDLLLHIENISINEVDLHQLIYSESTYQFDSPHDLDGNNVDFLKNCTSLGFNGTYQLPIASPFYMWLLERL
jgi:hypothetical protein